MPRVSYTHRSSTLERLSPHTIPELTNEATRSPGFIDSYNTRWYRFPGGRERISLLSITRSAFACSCLHDRVGVHGMQPPGSFTWKLNARLSERSAHDGYESFFHGGSKGDRCPFDRVLSICALALSAPRECLTGTLRSIYRHVGNIRKAYSEIRNFALRTVPVRRVSSVLSAP